MPVAARFGSAATTVAGLFASAAGRTNCQQVQAAVYLSWKPLEWVPAWLTTVASAVVLVSWTHPATVND